MSTKDKTDAVAIINGQAVNLKSGKKTPFATPVASDKIDPLTPVPPLAPSKEAEDQPTDLPVKNSKPYRGLR